MKLPTKCPICGTALVPGTVDGQVVCCCENEECQSVLVPGKPLQEVWRVITSPS